MLAYSLFLTILRERKEYYIIT